MFWNKDNQLLQALISMIHVLFSTFVLDVLCFSKVSFSERSDVHFRVDYRCLKIVMGSELFIIAPWLKKLINLTWGASSFPL